MYLVSGGGGVSNGSGGGGGAGNAEAHDETKANTAGWQLLLPAVTQEQVFARAHALCAAQFVRRGVRMIPAEEVIRTLFQKGELQGI